ncbi:MAG: hypothetical protein ACRESZ_23310 [Methylococcales bacterium]
MIRSIAPVVYSSVGLLTGIVYFCTLVSLVSQEAGLVWFSILLVAYLWFEIRRTAMRQRKLLFLHPAVLASVITFILAFGLTNILYFLPEDVIATVGLYPRVTESMNFLMVLVLLGAFAMWLGYRLGTGRRRIAGALARRGFLKKVLRHGYQTRPVFIVGCLIVSLLSRLLAIKLGIYGVNFTLAQINETAAYAQYIVIAESLSKLALLGAALQYYSAADRKPYSGSLLLVILSYEVFFGFLSGMKSQVVMPFFIIGFCSYFQRSHFPKWLVPAIVASVFVAYLVIEPFRTARFTDESFQNQNFTYILDTMFGDRSVASNKEGPAVGLLFLNRLNLTYVASSGIEFAHAGPLPPNSPDFLTDIMLEPLYAVIPRAIWKTKPEADIGRWYAQTVLGRDYNSLTSTAMSPFTYLYFAGGSIGVFLGFFIVGLIQRVCVERFLFAGSSGGAVVYFGILQGLVALDGTSGFFVTLVRLTPMLLLAQYGLFRK